MADQKQTETKLDDQVKHEKVQEGMQVTEYISELFIGVILPQGVPWDSLTQALKAVLRRLGYNLNIIRLTDEFRRISSSREEEEAFRWEGVSTGDRYKKTRDGVVRLCELIGKDAMAYLGVRRVRLSRDYGMGSRQAYCFQSLKRPEEVDFLRAVYGKSFVCIATHLFHRDKVESLAQDFAAEDFLANLDQVKGQAWNRLAHDEGLGDEGIKRTYGERVSAASEKADVFVNVAGTRSSILEELWRFMSSLFGSPFQTPTPDEQGMALANLASLRSAHPKRQVGAALTTDDGSVLAIGCNEVSAPHGGLYWAGDKDDRRDFQLKEYASRAMREEVLADVLERLVAGGYFSEKTENEFKNDRNAFFQRLSLDRNINDSRIMDALEYDRTVHAEMAAITDAARRGVSLQGCTLYCTTLPCHNCARHILAAGIRRVVYIQPYEKSLSRRLHGDAISIDPKSDSGGRRVRFEQFIGIAPSLYSFLFAFPSRGRLKPGGREFVEWDQEKAEPVISENSWVYLAEEANAGVKLLEELEKNHLLVE